MEQLIIDALKSACGNKNIKFQVIIKDEQLHIYANHRQNYHPQYAVLEANVGAAIASLELETIDSVWLYSRPLGQTEPNWQVLVELPTQVSEGERDTEASQKSQPQTDAFDDLPNLESLIEAEEKGDCDPTVSSSVGDTDKIQRNLSNERETDDDLPESVEIDITDFIFDEDSHSLEDTGLLQNTGLIHGSPLKEAEIDIMSPSFEREEVSADLTTEANPLAKYCFVTNEKLLTEAVPDPERETMRMVKFVHHLSESDRSQLLSILDTYFREGITPGVETALPAIQNWVKKIQELDETSRRLLAIWLSRYCFNPETTLEEFQTISAAKAAAESNKNSKSISSNTEYSFVTVPQNSNSSSTTEDLELHEPLFQLSPKVKKLLLPGIWILTTLIFIILGIFSHNSQTVVTSAQIPPLCSNTIGSPEYCRLAVNLAGEKAIAQAPESLFPLTEVTEAVANYGCGRYANLKAGIDISKIPPATTPVISTYGEKVFPHIYAIVVEQQQAQQPDKIKVGCVYTAGQGQRSPKKLAADIIPFDWPDRHYQRHSETKRGSFGIFTKPIKLGLSTIFAALGIAIVSRLNLGLKIHRTYTIYLVALPLGIAQLAILLLPSLNLVNFVGAMTIPVVVILIASLLLRDFQLNWKRGYSSVAITILLIIAIQLLSYSLCWALISGLV